MKFFSELVHNQYIVISFISWLIAQLIKFFTTLFSQKKIDFRKLTSSGGMPSSHSSSVCALATCVGLDHGFDSTLFALCFVFGIIVMYDAAGVRRETGKQARILNRMIADIMEKKPVYFQKDLKELIGHTPLEVFMGSLLGIALAIALFTLFN